MPSDRKSMGKPDSNPGDHETALASVMSIGLMAIVGEVSTQAASAAPKPKKYANCKAVNKVYPHGVGRTAAARDKTSGKRETSFKVSKAVYGLNTA